MSARLRRDLNILTGLALPSWSTGPQGDFVAIIAAAKAAGYEGVQHYIPQQVTAAGLSATGMGRILQPAEASTVAAGLKEAGCICATLHVGTGLDSDAEMDALARAVLDAQHASGLPLFIETHRATITQDIRRTIDLVGRFPDLRFNADLSHWYTGHEMAYGDFARKLEMMAPVLSRVRFMHGRISDPSCAQMTLEEDEDRPFLAHFEALWRACFAGYKSYGEHALPLIFAIELLPYRIDLGGQTHWTCYARQRRNSEGVWEDEADRWGQAELLWRLAQRWYEAA